MDGCDCEATLKLIAEGSLIPTRWHELTRCKHGWKVELAKSAKQVLKNKKKENIDDDVITKWTTMFEKFE